MESADYARSQYASPVNFMLSKPVGECYIILHKITDKDQNFLDAIITHFRMSDSQLY